MLEIVGKCQIAIILAHELSLAGFFQMALSVERPAKRYQMHIKSPAPHFSTQVLEDEDAAAKRESFLVSFSHSRSEHSGDGVQFVAPSRYAFAPAAAAAAAAAVIPTLLEILLSWFQGGSPKALTRLQPGPKLTIVFLPLPSPQLQC